MLLSQINSTLLKCIDEAHLESPLKEAAEYVLFPGGKRLRPLLTLCICSDFEGNVEELTEVACVVELLHVASLVHDDLPALDNDDERRGCPSCHMKFGEASAILLGDLLPMLGISLVESSKFPDFIKMRMIKSLTRSYLDLCRGQQLDLLCSGQQGSSVQCLQLKTGSLFRASVELGALAADVDESEMNSLSQFGIMVGEAFQLVDNLLDGEVIDMERLRELLEEIHGTTKRFSFTKNLYLTAQLLDEVFSETRSELFGEMEQRSLKIHNSVP